MMDAGRHPNIEVLVNSELIGLDGRAGNPALYYGGRAELRASIVGEVADRWIRDVVAGAAVID